MGMVGMVPPTPYYTVHPIGMMGAGVGVGVGVRVMSVAVVGMWVWWVC